MRGRNCKRVQCDEIWSFCYSKEKNVPEGKEGNAGDVWTWTSLCADSKLICNWVVGNRDAEYAKVLMDELAKRLNNWIQLTIDGHRAYLNAVEGTFGADIDYAMLVKLYGEAADSTPERKYSPAICTGAKKMCVEGRPVKKDVSTSYVESQNLTTRMSMKRFTRLTNAFSEKCDNHRHALALYFMYHNFVRVHKTLQCSPAIAAGVMNTLWEMKDLAKMIDADAPKLGPRGPYKKRPEKLN